MPIEDLGEKQRMCMLNKKALIIGCSGNSEGYLPGVEKDVKSIKNFLTSPYGGYWYKNEIIISYNETVNEIKNKIKSLKNENLDYLFIVFSGHGDFDSRKNERRLWIDEENYLYESDILNISSKQLTIIDACAGMEEEEEFSITAMESMKIVSSEKNYRKKFEEYLVKCPNQEIILYSSKKGEYSTDTSRGGLFIQSLLDIAKENQEYEVLTALKAFELSENKVTRNSKNKQHPDYFAYPKSGKKLPFSLKVEF